MKLGAILLAWLLLKMLYFFSGGFLQSLKLKGAVIRMALRLITIGRTVFPEGQEPVRSPKEFVTFSKLPPEEVLKELAKTYSRVFGEPPWCEVHTTQSVIEKLAREIMENGRLTIKTGEKPGEVVGFCWGAVISPAQIPQRVALARFRHNIKEGLRKTEGLSKLFGKEERVLYLDELAVAKEARGGLAPIQFLLRPLLELGWQKGAKKAIFWTSDRSHIKPLSLYMGFKPLYRIDEVLFMVNSDITYLLKLSQCYQPKKIAKIMRIASRIINAG